MRVRATFGTVLAAILVIAAGTVAWRWHVASVASLVNAQARTAGALLSAPEPDGARIVSALGRAEVNAIFDDPATGEHEAFVDGALLTGPPPPPPPLGAPVRPRGSAIELAVADLAHVPPRVVSVGPARLTLVLALASLTRWFALDAIACGLALVAIGIAAWIAARTATENMSRALEERRHAATEFQRFLADAGHELRTPLTILSGYIDILGGAKDGGDAIARVLPGMRAATARMRVLVEKMLLLSKLQSNVSAPQVIGVESVTNEVIEALRTRYPEREIRVEADAAASIFIDEDDLYEAERNLVENALRYAPGSPVLVTVSERDGAVTIDVADRGPGIPPQEQAMVFERFYRGAAHVDSEGSGLGLAIVRRVVERWNGTVTLASDASGTRVAMCFPRANKPA
jgi:signal transduction histidine kinase